MCISGAPADGTNLHVSFYPGPRLTRHFACSVLAGSRLMVHCYKKFISGSPADGSQRVKMKPGNPEPLHWTETGSQKIRMLVPVPANSTPQPHRALSSYSLITGFVVDKEIVFQMCVVDDGTRGEIGGVGMSKRTRVCLTVRNHHQVANDN